MNKPVSEELRIDESKLLREYDDGPKDTGRRGSFTLTLDDPKILVKRSSIKLNVEDLDVTALSESGVFGSRDRFLSGMSMTDIRKKSLQDVSRVFSGEGYLYKKPPKAYKKIWEKRLGIFFLLIHFMKWYKNNFSLDISD
jgi:hypothetical protein